MMFSSRGTHHRAHPEKACDRQGTQPPPPLQSLLSEGVGRQTNKPAAAGLPRARNSKFTVRHATLASQLFLSSHGTEAAAITGAKVLGAQSSPGIGDTRTSSPPHKTCHNPQQTCLRRGVGQVGERTSQGQLAVASSSLPVTSPRGRWITEVG